MDDALAPPRAGSAVLTVPNVITGVRLCLVPVAVWLVLGGRPGAALLVFVAAGLSDAADGWLARRGGASALGAVLDPLADKALLLSMLVVLAAAGSLPPALVALLVARDLAVVGGVAVLWLRGRAVAVRPHWSGKLGTALQVCLVAAVLAGAALGLRLSWLVAGLCWCVAAAALGSAARYARDAAR